MDKNKAVYKLKDLPPVYYLNLDGQPERAEYMEEQLKYWEVENYTRISAYDGREDDLSDIIKGRNIGMKQLTLPVLFLWRTMLICNL